MDILIEFLTDSHMWYLAIVGYFIMDKANKLLDLDANDFELPALYYLTKDKLFYGCGVATLIFSIIGADMQGEKYYKDMPSVTMSVFGEALGIFILGQISIGVRWVIVRGVRLLVSQD